MKSTTTTMGALLLGTLVEITSAQTSTSFNYENNGSDWTDPGCVPDDGVRL